ncbi:hydrogenase maturation nickel metallochaperone HypA [Streptomyces sp. NPDC058685]|uniref:hydrogenase maturation nickel metallochaperone HypA/HybF n=1 Tax=Streptomyces sp. NPDC058685 TaxID=3346598 RepID=UPI003665E085
MHELSIAMAVIDQVRGAVPDERVASLTLRIGELVAVVPEALDFSFGLAADGTLLAGARLVIETVDGEAHCDGCGRDTPTGMPPVLWCGDCERPLTLVAGRELEIVRVVVADEGPAGTAVGDTARDTTRDEETSHVPHR